VNNGIVYSVHVEESTLKQNYSIEQFKVSYSSLRKYNKDIPVKLYISPSNKIDISKYDLKFDNVEIVLFDAVADSRLQHQIYAKWTSHKWENSFKALRTFNFDNVLYVDTDTFFQKDPAFMFEKYGNKDLIYGKPDVSDKWTSIFNARNGGMNDGTYILSKHMLKYEKDLLKARVDYVFNLQESFKTIDIEEIKITGIQWVACQYGVSEYLININKPLQFFDENDVYIIHKMDEYNVLPNSVKQSFAIVHYLNYNMKHFAPSAFKVYNDIRK
jgi:hypothetical protein